MKNLDRLENSEWLESFAKDTISDITFNLYRTFSSDEEIHEFWNKFSDFYHISCSPFDETIENRRDIHEIYDILKRSQHMAEWHHLEILIGKYSDETMERAKKATEEKRKEYEWTNIIIWDPKSYMYLVWFFWGSSWRTAQYVINEIKNYFPEKFKEVKLI